MYGGDFDLQIAHRAGGTAGNSIALGETLVGSGAWAEGNQVDAVATPTADQFATAMVTALNSDHGGPVWAEQLSATEVLVWSRRPGDVRSACEAVFTQGGNAWDQATLSGGMAQVAQAQQETQSRGTSRRGREAAAATRDARKGASVATSLAQRRQDCPV